MGKSLIFTLEIEIIILFLDPKGWNANFDLPFKAREK